MNRYPPASSTKGPHLSFLGPVALSLALTVCLASTAARATQTGRPAGEGVSYSGASLSQALVDLQRRGLRILFTSYVVRPDMRVSVEVTAEQPREVLRELLAPHGLQAVEGPGGLLVVVPRPSRATTSLSGVVREQGSGKPLAQVQVVVLGTDLEATSDEEGRFSLAAVPPGTHRLEVRRVGFVVERRELSLAAGTPHDEFAIELVPAPIPLAEIVVTPSMISLRQGDPVSRLTFRSEEIDALPHLGDDLLRTMTLFPGIAGDELSAQFHVRGGRKDEVLVILDRIELFEPFHLRDFSNALSLVAPQAIAEVDLTLGGFPARFGDRMGGVLDMRTATPTGSRANLGLSVLNAQAGRSANFARGRGQWLGVARLGSLELGSDYLGEEEQPSYWDVFGKLRYQAGPKNELGLRLLRGDDALDFALVEQELGEDGEAVVEDEQVDTAYGNSYLWALHQAILSPRLFVDTVISRGRVDRDRRTAESERPSATLGEGMLRPPGSRRLPGLSTEGSEEQRLILRDERALEVVGAKQDWHVQASDRHYLQWGFDLRRMDFSYDYFNLSQLDDPLGGIRHTPRTRLLDLQDRLHGQQYAIYASDRARLWQPLTVELGLRYDEQSITHDQDLSPRVNLVLAASSRSTVRATWGHYSQSQRLYELQVEDEVEELFPAERTEQFGAGLEHVFSRGSTLRLDLYHRDIVNPRPRFENIFEPTSSFPEIEPDRKRIVPRRSTARGVELFVRSDERGRLAWWLNYAYTRVEDEIEGREVPRGIDQPHALNVNLRYRLPKRWTLNLAFRYHSGWPTTGIEDRLGDDEAPVFRPFNGERLPDYHRLDLRASREWNLSKGVLHLFIDIQNLYDRTNVAGVDVDLEVDDETDRVMAVEELWGGFLPTFGVDWKF